MLATYKISYSQGAIVPNNYTNPETGEEVIITQEDADKGNFERLEMEIKELLEKDTK